MSSVDDAREIIVVLGGGMLPDGSADASTVGRAAAAAALALASPDAAVVASGGGPPLSEARHTAARTRERGTEAAQIAHILRERGVEAGRIHLEDESMDTIGNAVFTAARYLKGLRPRPLTLVTSPFHADRARWAFARALPGWEIAVHTSAAGAEDDARAPNEPAYLVENERMIAGVANGDLAGMFDRLVSRWPEYAHYASRVR